MKKLTLILDQTNWLEATWVEEIVTQVEGEEDKVETTQVHCESFSGHREHIAMLRAKASEFGTELGEYEELIAECESKFIYPSDEELAKYELDNKIQEAESYLANTDWVKDYKLRHELGLELISDDSSKWEIINKRTEYIMYLKGAK